MEEQKNPMGNKPIEGAQQKPTDLKNGNKPQEGKPEDNSRQGGRRHDRRDRRFKDGQKGSKFRNDSSWYTRNAQLVKDSANISFNGISGTRLALGTFTATVPGSNPAQSTTLDWNKYRFPGIAISRFTPTYGETAVPGSEADTLNVAAQRLYTFIRHENSGARNYEAPDLIMYLMAMDSLYMLDACMIRMVGVANFYQDKNRYTGAKMLVSLGLSSAGADDFIRNLANYRGRVNNYSIRLSQLRTPSEIGIYARHYWLCSHVWKDRDSKTSQFFAYVPNAVFKWDPKISAGGSALTLTSPFKFSSGSTFNDIMDVAESLLTAMLSDEDAGVISGDIMKAYKENLWAPVLVDETYTVEPQFSLEVLEQWKNSSIVNVGISGYLQSNGLVSAGLKKSDTTSLGFASLQKLISTTQDHPDPTAIMVMTRNIVMSLDSEGTDITFGSEIINELAIFGMNDSGNAAQIADIVGGYINTYDAGTGPIVQLSAFDDHPAIYVVSGANEAEFDVTGIVFDPDSYGTLSFNDVRNLHNTALLSMWGVSGSGK